MALLVTTSLTILGGIVVYIIAQFLSKTFFDPVYDLRRAIGEVLSNLAFHAATIHTPAARSKDASDKAKEALMKSSSDLFAKSHAILFYKPLRCVFRLPSRQNIWIAAVQLRGLSTYVHEPESKSDNLEVINKRVKYIKKLLDLKSPEDND